MATEFGVVPGSVIPEVIPPVLEPGLTTDSSPQTDEVTLLDSTKQDSVGTPDFQQLAEGLSARRESEVSGTAIPSRADLFIPYYSSSLPLDFKEPPPYFLNAEEWEVYSHRKQVIDERMEEQLQGTF